ncbi:hypothetical protein VNO77_36445 [Canavalia gladiata]|uniref:Uncharacterized protein n=1 Tax=Canavalia gladiata TaxID=3824 RepID=A0AAN9PXR6_CANGL
MRFNSQRKRVKRDLTEISPQKIRLSVADYQTSMIYIVFTGHYGKFELESDSRYFYQVGNVLTLSSDDELIDEEMSFRFFLLTPCSGFFNFFPYITCFIRLFPIGSVFAVGNTLAGELEAELVE